MSLAKHKSMRSRKLLDAAKDQPCVSCGVDDGTTVAAHYTGRYSHMLGRGKGVKAWDHCAAHYCRKCHADVDAYRNGNDDGETISFLLDILETQRRLFEQGILKVA